MSRAHDSDIIGTRPAPVAPDFGLFAVLEDQRLASPEAAVRPVATATMRGPSTQARHEAHEVATRSLAGHRGKILAALTAHGPQTRLALHQVTGVAENSVNSAVNALLTSGHVRLQAALDPGTRRSIVELTPTEDAHDD